MPRLVLKDYYRVLGVSQDATGDQIKAAYRGRAKEVHPDLLGPDASQDDRQEAEELTREINEAWEVLKDPKKKDELDTWFRPWARTDASSHDFGNFDRSDFWERQYQPPRQQKVVVPEPEAFQIDGIWCWIEYSASVWSSQLRATVRIPLEDLFKIQEFDDLPHGAVLTDVYTVDAKGDIVGHGYSLRFLRNDVRKLKAEARRNADRRIWRQQLADLERDCNALVDQNRPVGHLQTLIAKARRDVESGLEWWQAQQHSTVVRSVREAQKEAQRVKTLDPSELLLDDLLNGKIHHPDLAYNQALIRKLDVYAFRSGGQVSTPTLEEVHEHYQRRIEGLTTQSQVLATDLKLEDDEPIILELAAEGAIELAPDTIQINGKGAYRVDYGRIKVGGKFVPAGMITVTEAIYEKNGARLGHISQFPSLPYGITLVIRVRVKVQDVEMLTNPYPDGKSLQNEVRRCRARLKKTRVEETGTTGSLDLWRY